MKRTFFILCALAGILVIGFFLFGSEHPDDVTPVSYEQDSSLEDSTVLPPITLASRTITFPDGSEADFRLSDAFDIDIAAEDLGKVRFMAMSPDGRMFVADMVDMNLSREGRIMILDDFSEEHQFEKMSTYLSGLRGPNDIAFYTDEEGNDWIYLTLTEHLIRYPYKAGDMKPVGEPEVIAEFPNAQSPTAIGVVWHITRTIVFVDDTLFVSVGSGCNSCEQPEGEVRAVILTMDPDGENARVYAEGVKNAVGMAWVDGSLYATENGVDHLGNDDPDDLVYKIVEGEDYGWPYCYEADGVKHEDKTQTWQREGVACENVPLSFAAFDAHTAPLGITYFDKAHPVLKNAFLVALHGSFQPAIGNGYQLMRLARDGSQEVFMDGFLDQDGERVARPVDILQKDANSFFLTDDFGKRIFYIYAR